MRGVFTAGVLDAFHDKRILPQFSAFYGVSAGALNLTSFLSGQRGRNLQIYTNICREPRFISLSRFLKGGHLFDLDYFFERVNQQSSLNMYRFQQTLTKTKFHVVSTCIESGLPEYTEITPSTSPEQLTLSLKASSALPMIYRTPVMLNGKQAMDGSLAAPLPFQKALEDGFRNIIVIRTRPEGFQKKPSPTGQLIAWQYRSQPAIASLIRQQTTVYNQSVASLSELSLQPDIHLKQIAPNQPLNSGRNTQDRGKLVADYHLGYSEGYSMAEKLSRLTGTDLLN